MKKIEYLRLYPQIIGIICIFCVLIIGGCSAAYLLAPKWAETISKTKEDEITQNIINLALLNQYSHAYYNNDSIEIRKLTKLFNNFVCYQINDDKCGWWIGKNGINDGVVYCNLLFPTKFFFRDLGSESQNIEHIKEMISVSYDTIIHLGIHSNSSFWDFQDSMENMRNSNYAIKKDSNLLSKGAYVKEFRLNLQTDEYITYTSYPYSSFSIYPKDKLFIQNKTKCIQTDSIIILLSFVVPLLLLVIFITVYYRQYIRTKYRKIAPSCISSFIKNEYLHPTIINSSEKLLNKIHEECGCRENDCTRFKLFLLYYEKEIVSLYEDDIFYKSILKLHEEYNDSFELILKDDKKNLDLEKWDINSLKQYFSESKRNLIKQKDNEIKTNSLFEKLLEEYGCKEYIAKHYPNEVLSIEEKRKILQEKESILEQIRKKSQEEAAKIQNAYPDGYKHYKECFIESDDKSIIANVQTVIRYDQLIKQWNQRKEVKPKWKDFSDDTKHPLQNTSHLNENAPIENTYVDYYIEDVLPTENYAILEFPKLGCVVWPHRTHISRSNRRGFMERDFEILLLKYLSNEQIEIRSDVTLLFKELIRPFEPDIAIIIKNSSIRIDIEIDEPYSGILREPTHFWRCGDEERDFNLTQHGWCVFRFAEKQIKTQPKECLALIARQIRRMRPSYIIPKSLSNILAPMPISIWTKDEALKMAEERIREQYLGIDQFGIVPNGIIKPEDTILTNAEKNALSCIEKQFRISQSRFYVNSAKRDERISFDSKSHSYTVNGVVYTPVSALLDEVFPKFDSDYWAERKATPLKTKKHILEEWGCKGAISREVGIFMHEQIARFFENKDYSDSYNFNYSGEFVNIHHNISIIKELNQFFDFNHHFNPIPLRVEWPIYIEEYKIAGTIDLMTRDKLGNTIMFDWKRTHKLGDEYNSNCFYTQKKNPFCAGVQLEKYWFEDCSFVKYSLQQNIYKYILKEKYGININNCYLVVFHQDYNCYHCIEVPNFREETLAVLDHWLKVVKNTI